MRIEHIFSMRRGFILAMILVAGGLLFSEAVSHSEADAFEEKSRIVGIQAQSSLQAMPAAIRKPNIVNATGTIEVAFSPNGGGAAMIVKAIAQTQKAIKVQAYGFTNTDIAKALLDASKRGVQVRVVLDKSQETEKYTAATFLVNAGVPVRIDNDFAIAHNKIMILDDETVITGSFNFTKAAEERNAENVLVIRGNKELARLYLQNWQWRWDASAAYKRKP